MSTKTTPESDDYKRGFRDGAKHMRDMDDEIAILDVLLGSATEDSLSPRQIKLLRAATAPK